MSKRMIQNNLIKNSIAAYFAAIEIHNKPNISYRYETVTLLLMNAWELALKSFIRKYIKNKDIFEDKTHTITFSKSLDYVDSYINEQKPKSFTSIRKNLEEIENFRNNFIHYYSEKLDPYLFMLISKSTLNYVEFVKKYFNKDIMNIDGLFILPLGFKLPFKPEDFLSKKAVEYSSTKESKEFILGIIKTIRELNEEGIEDSIVLGFDIYLESVKISTNSDIIAAITSIDNADITIAKTTNYNLTTDVNAQVINMSDEQFRKKWKYTHQELVKKCREVLPNFKLDKKFNEAKKSIESDINCAYRRKLDSKNPKSASKVFYTEIAVDKIKELLEKE